MKKFAYLIFILFLFGSCTFDENPYSFNREFDGGTFITPGGIVKYISGTADSATVIRDNYANVFTEITYTRMENGNNVDSILAYGHCFSESPNPFASPEDSIITIERLQRYSDVHFHDPNNTGEPTGFSDISTGDLIESVLPLKYETDYYIKSYVVTGYFDNGGEPVYENIAYNQNELMITTIQPEDRWVGGDDFDAPAPYDGGIAKGCVSFIYDGYMFVGFGRTEAPLGSTVALYRYDPVSNSWDRPYLDLILSSPNDNFTDAVAFVIEDVPLNEGIQHDCVYIGTGMKENGYATQEFYRLDFEANSGNPPGEQGTWVQITDGFAAQEFPGAARSNAVAFSINGIGYVGLGKLDNISEDPLSDFYKFDPSDKSEFQYGEWTEIDGFDGGARTGAAFFQIGEYIYVGLGESSTGSYFSDLWRGNQTTGDNLDWVRRSDFPGTGRTEAVGFNLGENGYMGTGWDGDSARSDFYRYSPFNNTWELKARYLGTARYEAVGEGVIIDDDIFKGYLGTGWNGTDYFDDFWHYRP